MSKEINMQEYGAEIARQAKLATKTIRRSSCQLRNNILRYAGKQLEKAREELMEANHKDVQIAIAKNESQPFVDRLRLKPEKIQRMCENIESVAQLPDPINQVSNLVSQPSGIKVGTIKVPIGVIAIIFESRPSVTAECSSLGIKSGNAMILRGGSEAIHSNKVIANCFYRALEQYNLPKGVLQLVERTDRAIVPQLLAQKDSIDLVIPRGGKGLIKTVRKYSDIPILDHLDGICHIYVDKDADMTVGLEVCDNAKTQSLSMCNTVETILIHQDIAHEFLPKLHRRLDGKNIEVRGCQRSRTIVPTIIAAGDEDWQTEYLDAIISIKIVASIEEAIDHIELYGSDHTDSIISKNTDAINTFIISVDSSSVMANTSTRFADGFEYGLGAEIGISTARIHARGPVGLEGLVISKYVVYSDGAVRI